MRMPRAGELRHRVKILRPYEAQDVVGAAAVAYERIGETWARVEPLSGSEKLRTEQLQAELSHRVNIRYRTDMLEDMEFEIEGRRLRIVHISDLEFRHVWLECLCKEIVGT